ncbi:MAG TPA: flagellar hook-length control protein FliK, partial [Candidatus Angelobacter sp.]|nr:flagellar hook-length control protein FliK [Candidatus Angelobacter sp.]
MKTDDFGKVEVRTQLRDSQVGLAVESERGDLKTYLSPEIPGLQTTLHQHSLHLESMDFSHQGGQSAGSQGGSYRGSSAGGFDGERQSHAPPGNWPMRPSRSAAAEMAEALSLETSWPRTAGINIHA